VTEGVPVGLDGVSRRFGRLQAVDDVTFDIQPGEILGLLGPNGAGKTTTMRLLTGYLRADRGRVSVGGIDAATDPVGARRLIGYLPEAAPVPRELTPREFLSYCTKLRSVPRSRRRAAQASALEQTGLSDVADQVIGTLSKGYRQRVGIAQALVHEPPVLVLDEPTAGLDPRQVAETRAMITKLGRRRTILFSSHLLAEVSALCKRVVILNHGRVVAGGIQPTSDLGRRSATTRVEARITGDPELAARLLSRLDGVDQARPGTERVVVTGPDAALPGRVSAALVEGGFGLIELHTSTDTLEEAYLRLVRE
jgi:ABC-2 type transport system ATP-binding protein